MNADTPLSETTVGLQALNRLEAAGIRTLGELAEKSRDELLSLPRFGQTCLNECRAVLGGAGMRLRHGGRAKRPWRLKYDEGTRAEIIRLRGEGLSYRRIGEKVGTSPQTALDIVNASGAKRKAAPVDQRRLKALQAEAARIREEWMTATEAAAALALDKSHTCAQCRAGRFPGAFRMGEGAHSVWLIPRESVEAYRKR